MPAQPQVLATLSNAAPSTGSVTYATISSWMNFSTAETSSTQPWAAAGTLARLVVRLDVAPGAGKSRSFTIRINGVDTALTCTISDTALTARDLTHSVAIAAGDRLTLQTTPTGTPAAVGAQGVRLVLEFTSTAAGESGYGWGCFTILSTAPATKYAAPFSGTAWVATAADVTEVVPLTGTITALYLLSATAIGGSRSDTGTLYLNGVKQDGTGGTPNTTASLTPGNTVASSSFSLPVAPGDTLYLEGVKVGTGSEAVGYGLRLVATTPGQSVVASGATTTSASATRYNTPGWGASAWNATEATLALDGGITAIVLSQLRVRLTAAPGSGKSYTFDLRRNGASPGGTPTVTVADLATTGSDASGTVTVADPDAWALRCVPAGTPTVVTSRWAMIQSAAAGAAVETAQPYVWGPL